VDGVDKSGNHIVRLDWPDADGQHYVDRRSSCPTHACPWCVPLQVQSQVIESLISLTNGSPFCMATSLRRASGGCSLVLSISYHHFLLDQSFEIVGW
jgi:hypothetical protein